MTRVCGRARFRPIMATAALGAFVASVSAQTGPAPRQLDEVLVTATRIEEPARELPYATAALSRETLEERAPRTLPDALSQESSVMVQKTAVGQGSPFIRGFTGFRTVLLIDGFRLNHAAFRDGPNQYWNTVDAWSLERLEVVKGPTSAQYGSDAVGGTVHARTVAPRFEKGRPVSFGQAQHRFSSAEHSHVSRLEAGAGLSEATAFVVGATWKDFGDLRGGRDTGLQPQTGYDEHALDLKLEHRWRGGARLTLAHQAVQQDDVWRTHATIHGSRWEGTRPGSNLVRVLDQGRELTYARLDADELAGAWRALHLGVAWQRQTEDEFRRRANLRSEEQGFAVATLGTFAHARWETPAGRWVAGAEFYSDRVDSFLREFDPAGVLAAVRVQGPVADDARHDLSGLFVEDRVRLTPRLHAIVGGRLQHTRTHARKVAMPGRTEAFAIKAETTAFAGNVRLIQSIVPRGYWKAFAGASQGVRAPNLSDLTRFDIAEAGQIETPVAALDPERFLTFEGGMRAASARAQAEVVYYHTTIDQLIVRTPTGAKVAGLDEVTKRNSGRGYIHGVELDTRAAITDALSLRGVMSWMEGRLESYPTAAPVLVEEPVSRLMPLTAIGAARWQRGAWWATATVTHALKADRLAAQDRVDTERIPIGGTPGYTVGSVRVGWHFADHLLLTAALENVTNEDYRIHGSGLNEPGRNLVLTTRLRF